MKIDMHCHTQEGSVDGHVLVKDYIEKLIEQGFGGMLITDHGTYAGYNYWWNNVRGRFYKDFRVFRGMEYDTSDYGHFIVIMPEDVNLSILELRGLTLKKLVKIVHFYGGVLGPAHPCGEPILSFYNTKFRLRGEKDKLLRNFDFIETYNACESTKSNTAARQLAVQYKKPRIGGSDAHSIGCVGMGYTEIPEEITVESDLIEYLLSKPRTVSDGERYCHTTKDRLGKWNKGLIASFYLFNKVAAMIQFPKRFRQLHLIAREMEREKGVPIHQ
jgi:predicted metal-dependent phosphoesterase TrpH